MGNPRRLVAELLVSLASGTILAGVAKAVAATTSAQWLAKPVPIWSLVLASATAVFLAAFLIRTRSVRPKRVLVMIPAFVQKHWLAEFVHNGVRFLEGRGYDAVLKLPLHDFSGQGQVLQIAGASRQASNYAGAFLIVAEPHAMTEALRRFCTTVRFPIIFVDVMPFERPEEFPSRSYFVGSSQVEIGAEAARWVVERMTSAGNLTPRILVVAGTGQTGRQKAFAEKVNDKLPGALVEINQHGEFVRGRASDIVGRYLRKLRQQGVSLDAIFCTNDEMALGAIDALQEERVRGRVYDDLIVMGVDGTDEAMSVIRSGGTNLQATVVQDARRVAEMATSILIRAAGGESPQTITTLRVNVYPHDSP